MPEGLAQPAQDSAPARVIVDELANGVQYVAALVVHVARTFAVHAVHADNRRIVSDQLSLPDGVLGARLLALLALRIQAFRVIREALVDPHVGGVLHRDAVAEPFVRALVHDDEVPADSVACLRAIATEVSVQVAIAVGDRALVLHAEVRSLDELVAILVPRERTEPALEALQHRLDLLKLLRGGVEVIVERIEVERQLSLLSFVDVAEMRVMARVHRDVVVVDRVDDEPFVGGGSVGVTGGAAQSAVRDIEQRVGNGDRDALAVGLIGVDVLVRPPNAGAQSFVGGHDPGAREAVAAPDEPSIPGRANGDGRLAVIIDGDRFSGAPPLRRDERDEEGIAIAPGAQLESVLHDAVDDERHLQIDLHLAPERVLEHTIRDRIMAGDAAVDRMHLDVQVVEGDVPPRALGRVRAADRVGVGEDRRGDLRRQRNRHCRNATTKEDYLPGAVGRPASGCGLSTSVLMFSLAAPGRPAHRPQQVVISCSRLHGARPSRARSSYSCGGSVPSRFLTK